VASGVDRSTNGREELETLAPDEQPDPVRTPQRLPHPRGSMTGRVISRPAVHRVVTLCSGKDVCQGIFTLQGLDNLCNGKDAWTRLGGRVSPGGRRMALRGLGRGEEGLPSLTPPRDGGSTFSESPRKKTEPSQDPELVSPRQSVITNSCPSEDAESSGTLLGSRSGQLREDVDIGELSPSPAWWEPRLSRVSGR